LLLLLLSGIVAADIVVAVTAAVLFVVDVLSDLSGRPQDVILQRLATR